MSNAILEFCLRFHAFTNVDLLTQGLYRIRVSVRSKDGLELLSAPGGADLSSPSTTLISVKGAGSISSANSSVRMRSGSLRTSDIVGVPYAIFPKDPPASESFVRGKPVDNSLALYRAPKHDEQWFCTRQMLVRYVDEKIELNEGAHFRIVRPFGKGEEEEVYVVFALDRAEFDEDPEKGSDFKVASKFSSVCGRKFCVNKPASGVHEYLPVFFDDPVRAGFCLAECTVHSTVLQLKFDPEPSPFITPRKQPIIKRALSSSSKNKKMKGKKIGGEKSLASSIDAFAEYLFGKAVRKSDEKHRKQPERKSKPMANLGPFTATICLTMYREAQLRHRGRHHHQCLQKCPRHSIGEIRCVAQSKIAHFGEF